ncbi:MAG: carboxypeptidase regulatory-like domain-containing protein, partial [Longimicrobiales bacterium]
MRSNRFSSWLITCCLALVLPLAKPVAAQETGTVRGTVRNAEGQPIPGAQVYLEGTQIGAVTNSDGRFAIERVPVGSYTVLAEVLGFTTGRQANVTVVAGQRVVANFDLRTQALSLSEVVVTGVTEATSRARLPFSVARVGKESIPVAPRSAVASIQGKVAGAMIVQSTQPGEPANILLRSPTSINGNNAPLLVVDGAILTASSVDINSLDIESVEVVKGAAAASLYGSRAASGVIQIRTARGSAIPENRTRFTVRTEYGTNDLPREIEWAQQHPYRQNANGEFLNNAGQVVPRTGAVFKAVPFQDGTYPTPVYNHVESLFDPGPDMTQSASLGYNGGNTSWLATGSYQRTKGVTLELEGYKRADFRVNLDHRLANDLSFSASLFHLRSTQDDAFGGA